MSAGDPGISRPDTRAYLAAIRAHPADADPRERVLAGALAFARGDDDALWDISATLAADCRRHGMIGHLPGALQGVTMAQILRGDWAAARASAAEGLRLADDMSQPIRAAYLLFLVSLLAALAGDEQGCRSWLAEYDRQATHEYNRLKHRGVDLALLELGHGRFAAALGWLRQADAAWGIDDSRFMYQPDLAEAAARGGRPDLAQQAAAGFGGWANYCAQPWALAVAARCRALVSPDDQAGCHYAEAVRLHTGAGRPFEHARSQLLYGEWLRRQRHRADAREQLAAALDTFEHLGANSWAHRARTELRATGLARTRVHQPGPLARLTPQEFQIVQLAATGASNHDIAAALFLSHRTVGYHLYKAYPKLGVSSRTELAALLPR